MTPASSTSVPLLPAASRPVVLIPACNRMLGIHPFHIVGGKYVEAVRLAGCLPWVMPSGAPDELDDLLAQADGVFLTGSPSNVDPSHFGKPVHDPSLPLDPARDALTLRLIPPVLERGIPLLAVCRGFQEANVALGGSLHQALQEQPGFADHREDESLPEAAQYAPAHTARLAPGGLLDGLLGTPEITVNSLHGQGVHRLAAGLRVEALAPDGVVEAFTAPGAPGFNLAVQWHPEWQAADNPVSMRLLGAFGDACRAYRARRDAQPPRQEQRPHVP